MCTKYQGRSCQSVTRGVKASEEDGPANGAQNRRVTHTRHRASVPHLESQAAASRHPLICPKVSSSISVFTDALGVASTVTSGRTSAALQQPHRRMNVSVLCQLSRFHTSRCRGRYFVDRWKCRVPERPPRHGPAGSARGVREQFTQGESLLI